MVVILVLVTVLATGCAVGVPPGGAGPAVPADDAEPVSARGVAPCSTLPQRQAPAPRRDAELLPDIALRCLTSSAAVQLRELRGKPMVINMWATWCGPCRTEMPMLEAANDDYDGRVTFIGVNTKDASTSAASFLEEVGVSYAQLVDPSAELLRSTRVPGLPVTLAVAADGAVVGQHAGALDRAQLDDLVAAASR
jgi:cytochrome c biogenesis protein CcmG/thiol:disulfide interchange protein DsbE